MCGIAGLRANGSLPRERGETLVRNMTSRLVHRGPDDAGYFVTEAVALGMRRLAIIDRAHGRQPMFSDDGTLALVFNGEIYNHRSLRAVLASDGCRFKTNCDTEVVLRVIERDGVEGIKRLEGMFALALWDTGSARLTLARDWLGQKSLYWTETPQGFAFASEIKALLTLPGVTARLNPEALSHYMSLRYLPGEDTFFAGIHKLPAAHVMTVDADGRTLRELWRPAYGPKHALSERQIIDRLDGLMSEVVVEHLMSEVPLGAFLSGGIDSSLIVAYGSRTLESPLTTFAIGVRDEAQNELSWARIVADHCHTRHTETIVDPDLALLTPRMVAALEEPVDPFGAGVYVVSEVARRQVTVALGGDGGDELFAGYDRYKGQAFADLYAQVPRLLRHQILRPAIRRLPDSYGYNTLTSRLRWLDKVADSSGFERYAESAAYLRFTHALKSELFAPRLWRDVGSNVSEHLLEPYFAGDSAAEFLDQMLHADCQTRLMENQLPTVDKLAMAHSLELRSPLLDRRIAEFAMRIPAELKLKRGRMKYVTRALAARCLPDTIASRPKKGFGFPLALWLRGPLSGLMQRTIDDSRFVASGLFQREPLQRMLDQHVSGRLDHNYRLWMIFNLEMFWRVYIDGDAIDEIERWVSRDRQPATATSPRAARA